MKTIYIANDDTKPIQLSVPENFVRSVERLAPSIREVLGEKGRSPDLEPMLERGAEWLTILATPGDVTLMVDSTYVLGAHVVTCLAVLESNTLTRAAKNDFSQILAFLGGAASCFILPRPLPDLRKLKAKAPKPIQDLYKQLRNDPKPEHYFWKLKLTDAIDLDNVLKNQVNPQLIALRADLRRSTANHRYALEHLSRKSSMRALPVKVAGRKRSLRPLSQ